MEPSPDDCNDDDDCDDNGNDVTITLSILAFCTTYDARGDVDDKCSFALLYAISQSAPIVIVSWLLL